MKNESQDLQRMKKKKCTKANFTFQGWMEDNLGKFTYFLC